MRILGYVICYVIVLLGLVLVGQARAETSIEVRFSENPPTLYLLQDGKVEVTYPVAVARPEVKAKFRLPVVGEATRVLVHAPWYPTPLSRAVFPSQHKGVSLPAMVPWDDPRNLIGVGKIILVFPPGWSSKPLRIHGTPEPSSIGKHVSSGCVRMLNADFIDLAHRLEQVKLPISVTWKE